MALRWLVGQTGNNWHAAGYRRVREHCEQSGDSPWIALTKLADGALSLPHTDGLVLAFNEIVAELNALESGGSLEAVVDLLLPASDSTSQDLRALALQVLEDTGGDDRKRFLQQLVQAIAKPEVPDEVEDVRIMSLHKSKGLSAPVTLICGCVQGLLPKLPAPGIPAVQAASEMEEQRRLFFVATTRVKAALPGKPSILIITYSSTMPTATALNSGIAPAHTRYGIATLHASSFLAELGPAAPPPVAVP